MDWSLEKIYRQQVRGNVPQRRHLRVLGEATEEEADYSEADILKTKEEIKQAIDNLSFDDSKEADKLLKQIYNFPTYKNVKKTLGGKGYSPLIFKRFSADIQRLIEDVPPGSRDQFINYLQTPDESLVFPTEIREGKLSNLIGDRLDANLVDYVMRHTGQDEGGRGVGMGELALALIFKNLGAGGQKKKANVSSAKEAFSKAKEEFKANVGNKGFGESSIKQRIKDSDLDASKYDNQYIYNLDKAYNDFLIERGRKVKGDLELDGEEFEIKGEGATLGPRPDDVSGRHKKDTANSLAAMGIKEKGNGYIVGGQQISGLNNLPVAISTAYSLSEDQDGFKNIFKDFLKVSGEFGSIDDHYNALSFDLSNPASIQNGISLLSFIDYSEKEEFEHFMTHDVGSGGAGTGRYVYVSGKPIEMAKKLLESSARFEKVSRSNLRPRIGFGSNYAGMMPTSVSVTDQEVDKIEEEESIEYY
tara:strand:+ start:1465 stop:2886 length:1422 start_codon:yes stop_codon:yes gene_type:complete